MPPLIALFLLQALGPCDILDKQERKTTYKCPGTLQMMEIYDGKRNWQTAISFERDEALKKKVEKEIQKFLDEQKCKQKKNLSFDCGSFLAFREKDERSKTLERYLVGIEKK